MAIYDRRYTLLHQKPLEALGKRIHGSRPEESLLVGPQLVVELWVVDIGGVRLGRFGRDRGRALKKTFKSRSLPAVLQHW